MVRTATFALLCLYVFSCPLAAPGPEHWQDLARKDLDAARRLILEAHPGAIDEANPTIRQWIDRGHRDASALLPEVFNYDSMLAVVRYYIAGFQDGHLFYSDNIRPGDARMFTTGWAVRRKGGRDRVLAVAPDWPAPLPPIGSALTGCDGDDVDTLVRERVAPYVDRRPFARVSSMLVGMLDLQILKRHALQSCQFTTPDGEQIEIAVSYQPLTTDEYWDILVAPAARPGTRAENGWSLSDGVLWVRAGDFSLSPEGVTALNAMLEELRALQDVAAIVFDARGNGGGDSSVGDWIFEAATGGLAFDRSGLEALPRAHAQWRVSDVAIRSAQSFVNRRIAQYGKDSAEADFARAHLSGLQEARAAGQRWMEQPAGYRVDRAEVARRGGRLLRFDGKLVLLTDSNCASACLDFADTVLQVPGALHAGQETSGDAVYIDTAWETLPSGNGFVIPLKVWRNRLRGNNETLVPQVPIPLDVLDEDAIRRRVLAIAKQA